MTWLAILGVGLGSFAFRLGPLLLLERATLSPVADRLIRHAGLAAITSLIVTSTANQATGQVTIPTLVAVGVGLACAARDGSMIRLLALGGATYASLAIAAGLIVR